MNKQDHWENVYQTKGRKEVSWFSEHLDTSLRMIANTGVGKMRRSSTLAPATQT